MRCPQGRKPIAISSSQDNSKFIAYARVNPAWLPWLQREFGWTDRYALNYMRV